MLEPFIEDKVFTFKIYFPHNNVKNIIEDYEKYKKRNKQKNSQK